MAGELYEGATRRWRSIPGPLRRALTVISAELGARITPLLDGLRLMARSGWAPMLLFCLAFLLVKSSASWLWQLERLLIGPQELNTFWMAADEPLRIVNEGN